MNFRLILPLLVFSVFCRAESFSTHCNDKETILFNCILKDSKKIGSVCRSQPVEGSSEPPYLQYRFGEIDSIEFSLPKSISAGSSGERLFFHSRDKTLDNLEVTEDALIFTNGNYLYKPTFIRQGPYERHVPIRSYIEVGKIGWRSFREVMECHNPDAGKNMFSTVFIKSHLNIGVKGKKVNFKKVERFFRKVEKFFDSPPPSPSHQPPNKSFKGRRFWHAPKTRP